ncbi:MAG: ATP-binding protein [Syntrophobacteraceae bacterium]|nr:ATP-binding protein [Syntrophobacteraceae bacterium]
MGSDNRKVELEIELKQLRLRVLELESKARDRQEMEKTLRDQLSFLQILIDTIPNPIFFKNKAGKYLGCNKAFERRIGLNRGDIIGKSASDLFAQEIAASYEQHDAELFDQPREMTYETPLTYADGRTRDTIITKGIFTDSVGEVCGLVGVTLDITERKRAEEALQKAHDELEKRVEERTAALAEANLNLEKEVGKRSRIAEELRISSEKLKIFAYSIAHDLKSPSVGIHGLARLLMKNLQGFPGDKAAAFCEQIMKASEHVASLVDAINLYISTKETPLKIEEIAMDQIFCMLRDEFSARLSARRVQLLAPEGAPLVRADKICLLRLFRNLIDNALKYGGEGLTRIEADYEKSEDFHRFAVKDDGVGMEPDESIFNLFQRQATSSKTEGTGLGLAIVKEIVELHRGKIWVEKGQNKGTVFHLLFPCGL